MVVQVSPATPATDAGVGQPAVAVVALGWRVVLVTRRRPAVAQGVVSAGWRGARSLVDRGGEGDGEQERERAEVEERDDEDEAAEEVVGGRERVVGRVRAQGESQ